MTMIGCTLLVGLAAVGCSQSTEPTDTKPSVDPDAELTGKADGLSNHYTELRGELPMDDVLFGEIDYPDYFHGYTIELEAGQTVQFTTWADARGLVRLYGPAGPHSSEERPRFGRAQVRGSTHARGERYQNEFSFEVEEGGTYMLVYGPYWVWNSEYELSTKCLAGCQSDPEPSECADDSDCVDGWCRQNGFDPAEGSQCVPFVGEGESCGGFAPPPHVDACAPEFTCVYRPFVADAPGKCRNVVTVEELRNNPDQWDGERVSIDGYINTGYAICTQMACTVDNPCCNSCGASQTLDDDQNSGTREGLTLVKDGETIGCGGNNCTYLDNCSVADGEFRALGVFHAGQYGVGELTVEELTSLESL
jgi:hypothetical protein